MSPAIIGRGKIGLYGKGMGEEAWRREQDE